MYDKIHFKDIFVILSSISRCLSNNSLLKYLKSFAADEAF